MNSNLSIHLSHPSRKRLISDRWMDRMDVFKFSSEITPVSPQGIILGTCGKCNTQRFQGYFPMLQIKPYAIREDLHRRKYQNHHSVIYEIVKPIHGTVVFLPVRSALPQNSKPDRVLLRTGLRRAKSERKTPSSKMSFIGDGSSPHRKPVSRIYGGKKQYEIQSEK